jgi:aspartate kinase
MSRYGAKVLHYQGVQTARRYGITLVCRHNRAPFVTGTVIGADVTSGGGIVLNTHSRVLGYSTAAEADVAHRTFAAEGIDTIRLPGSPTLAVVGGYLDIDQFHRAHDLPQARTLGIPVTSIAGTRATTHTATDPSMARELAQRLHEDLSQTRSDEMAR